MKWLSLWARICVLFGLLLVPPVQITYGQTGPVDFQKGDVFAGTGYGRIKVFDSSGNLKGVLDTTSGSIEETGMCVDSAGNLYTTNFTAQNMSRFTSSGELDKHPWGGPFGIRPESCVVDSSGNIYTGEVDGAQYIRKWDATGQLLATYAPATQDRGIDWIDLASDQCTMYYTSEGSSVKRFDVCQNTQLADFASGLTRPCFALRIRESNEVMVACSSQVYRLGSDGASIQTYTTESVGETSFFFALNLDPDGSSFWTAGYSTGNVYKIDIDSGAVLTSFNAAKEGPSLAGLAVFSELTTGLEDTDGDALLDDWEVNGYDTDGDGSRDLDLAAMGAKPDRKDIFVWIDWLEKTTEPTHSHRPSDAALDMVRESFEKEGIKLHIQFGTGTEETNELEVIGSLLEEGMVLDEVSDLRSASLLSNDTRPGMASVFHYALFAHYLPQFLIVCPEVKLARPTGIGGFADTSDLVVAMQPYIDKDKFTQFQEAVTFMHELGHTLGLGHGGITSDGERLDENFKPNHLSIMNYAFGREGLIRDGDTGLLDYSHFGSDSIPDLKEDGGLSETGGLGAPAVDAYGTRWFCGADDKEGEFTLQANGSIDWNCSGEIDSGTVKANLQQGHPLIPFCPNYYDDLSAGASEWDHLQFSYGTVGIHFSVLPEYPTLDPSVLVDGPDMDADVILGIAPVTPPMLTVEIHLPLVLCTGD